MLRRTDLLGSLTDDLLKKIAGFAFVKHLERGQVLFSEHERALGLYVVASGELRSIRQNTDGREQVLSTERAGAILAAVPVFDEGKFFSTMVADARTDVLCIEKRYVCTLCREHPELLWNLASALARKVRQYAELIETLALQNVEQRVARYLLTVAQERGARLGNGYTFELTWTRGEIAIRLGSTREVVSRSLSHLDTIGLIHLEGRRLITLPDVRNLSVFAGAQCQFGEIGLDSEISLEMR